MKLTLKIFYAIICLIVSVSVSNAQDYHADHIVFSVKDVAEGNTRFETKTIQKGIKAVTFYFKGMEKNPLPEAVKISWSVPFIDLAGYWTPDSKDTRFISMKTTLKANIANQAPVVSFYNDNNLNRYTFALSDAFRRSLLYFSVNEREARLNCSYTISLSAAEQKKEYQVTVFVDERETPWYESVKEVSSWWAGMPAYHPAITPAAAKMPIYSTWYSYHKDFTEQQLLGECRQAKTLGYETIIVDDGWETLEDGGGYAYTGDWEPKRIGDMRAFVDKVHAMGMKFMLWYSVPFVGYKSDVFEKFKGKYVYLNNRLSAGVLDPRYPEVRKYIVSKYVKHLKDWGLDGFKLDFIDNFTNQDTEAPAVTAEADITSLYQGVDQLMTEIKNALTAVRPDILIEFRQTYIGPSMRKYGNMFRAGDCPNAALTNRIRTTDIKLLAGSTATHSDMMMWNYEEPVPIAALQFNNILFSVPQLSVRLKEIPASHLNMVRFYTRFWLDNRDIFLDGKFEAFHPEMNYPLLQGTSGSRMIAALYADVPVTFKTELSRLTIVNARNNDKVWVDVKAAAKYNLKIVDCEGKTREEKELHLAGGLNSFKVPPSGIIILSKL